MSDIWLDSERTAGDCVVEVTAERIASARDSFARQSGRSGRLRVYAEPTSICSMRPFYLTGIQVETESDGFMPVISIVRGCIQVATISVAEAMRVQEPYPMRIYNPPRQNLSIEVMEVGKPLRIRCFWRHDGM